MRKATIAGLLLLCACSRRTGSNPPFSPEESIRAMQIAPGYRVELVASEPDVVSPVAMDVDENGRIYVVEDRGYPLDVKGRVGRVKLLQDTDGDGKPDRTTTFADKMVLPNGVMCWRKGILVTDAPDLWYMEDTNGDGVADIRRVVLTGFAFTNPQHTVNAPLYGLDNWIYLAHENPATAIVFQKEFGDRGSDIKFAERPEIALNARGRNIRFRPDTFEIEALSGTSQFGHAFDDFGRHFVLNNTYHARHEVIAARYLKRNPDLPVASATEEMSDHGVPAKVYPIVAKARFEMLTNVGEFTSACGLTFWQGGAFVAEPAHNLVHRDVYLPRGSTFKASRDRDAVEFLASRDPWFRPVNFYGGPDGALYMMDYYRLVIEHPEWMSTEAFKNTRDLTAGIDRGRIYRIVPAEWKGGPAPRLGAAPAAELVKHLSSDNPWWRRTAQRLLVDRKPPEAVGALAAVAADGASPAGRVHALWTLDGIGRLENDLIAKTLRDTAPGVRENAIRLAETRMQKDAALSRQLIALGNDPDARVRFQLLCTLGDLATPAARDVRDRLLAADFDGRWTQIAALSASPEEAGRLFQVAIRRSAPASFFRQAAAVIGARHRTPEILGVLDAVSRAAGRGGAAGAGAAPRPSASAAKAGNSAGAPRLDEPEAGAASRPSASAVKAGSSAAARSGEPPSAPTSGAAGSGAASRSSASAATAGRAAGGRSGEPQAAATGGAAGTGAASRSAASAATAGSAAAGRSGEPRAAATGGAAETGATQAGAAQSPGGAPAIPTQPDDWRAAALEGLAAGLRGKRAAPVAAIEQRLVALFSRADAPIRRGALHVLEQYDALAGGAQTAAALQRAEKDARDPAIAPERRADSLGLLALAGAEKRRTLFESVVKPTEPEAVQIAAVRAIGRIPGEETGRFMLANWRTFTANVRMEAADALYRDPKRHPMVVQALKNGNIQPWTLAFRHRRQLIMHRDPAIRDAARPLLESAGDRGQVIAKYQPALTLSADSGRGRMVFKSVCVKCHKLDGVGAEVGPDLATVRHQPKSELLTAILDPNQSISQGFEAYVVETASGGSIDGVMGPQTATTITLRHEEGKQDVIPRKDIRNMYVTNLSAMPADLEKQIGVQQMADLLEYLKTGH